jgi:predicted nucleotidyltransferase
MEDIKDRLGEYKYNYFMNLQKYLDTELYFFGSIKRNDYFEKHSDIDVMVITDNVDSMISKVKNYLNSKKTDVKKLYQRFYKFPNKLITGYKIKYDDGKFSYDILIYNDKYKNELLENMKDMINLPFYIVFCLIILKYLYYNFKLISKNCFVKLKMLIFTSYFSNKLLPYNTSEVTTIIVD